MEHEDDGDINCNLHTWNGHQKRGKRGGRVENRTINRNHPTYCVIEIGRNTERRPNDLRKLAATWTPEIDCLDSVNHGRVQVSSYPSLSYPFWVLNLQSLGDFAKKYLPNKQLIRYAKCPCRRILKEFLELIKLISPFVMFFFYHSSYCNHFNRDSPREQVVSNNIRITQRKISV